MGTMPFAEESVEQLGHIRRDRHVGKLDQEITSAVDGILFGVAQGIFDILETKVEIASAVDLEDAAASLLEFGDLGRNCGGLVAVSIVGVGSRHDVRGAVLGCHRHHGDSFLERNCPVVQTGQDMAVDIDKGPV
jgi:hypothetical protein